MSDMMIIFLSVNYQKSPTHAGGVGLYLEETLQYRVRNDLLLEANKCEDLWIEIESKQANKSLIVVVVYRHPN